MRKPANAVVFLGGGNITRALISGLHLANYMQPLLVHDRNPEKLRALRRQFKVEIALDLKNALERAKILMIAVRPTSIADLLKAVKNYEVAKTPTVAVSLAAGVPLRNLRRAASQFHWARAMPSPVSRMARGLTALVFEPNFPPKIRSETIRFFRQVGPTLEIPVVSQSCVARKSASACTCHFAMLLCDVCNDVMIYVPFAR